MKNIIISSLYLLLLFCLSKFVFEPSYLYYEIPWLDIPMHIMGGFGVASLVYAVMKYKNKEVSYSNLFISYIAVATTWEIYEYFNNMFFFALWSGWIDTIKDLVDGFIGMSLAYLFIKK